MSDNWFNQYYVVGDGVNYGFHLNKEDAIKHCNNMKGVKRAEVWNGGKKIYAKLYQ